MKRLCALVLAASLALSLPGCGRSNGNTATSRLENQGAVSTPGHMSLSWLALKEAAYPAFPQQPDVPENGDWDAYSEAYDQYRKQLRKLRGDGIPEGTVQALTAFSGQSAPLALEGCEEENFLYSPVSLWYALAMLAKCADGSSRAQVLEALNAPTTQELQTQAKHLWSGLYTDDGISSLLLANSVWLNQNTAEDQYHPDTLELLADHYYAGSYAVPMGHPIADTAVTDWVSEQTRGLLDSGDPVVQTDPNTMFLLLSCLYYQAGWTDTFSERLTEPDRFTASDGSEVTVDFMHTTRDDMAVFHPNYQAASLRTNLGELIFVLPEEGTTPEELLRTPELLSSLDFREPNAVFSEVQWSVPKFDITANLDLMETLKAMGITDLPDPEKADLSALSKPTTPYPTYLDGATQLARITVDENGVEAAAVTVLSAPTAAAPAADPPVCVMDLDRPFLFVLRTQGIPLFVGIINQI